MDNLDDTSPSKLLEENNILNARVQELEYIMQEKHCSATIENMDYHQSKSYIENLLCFSDTPIMVWDQDFKLTHINLALEHLCGRSAQEVINEHVSILFPKDQLDSALDHLENSKKGMPWLSTKISIQHIDGSIHHISWNSSNLYSSDNKTLIATTAQGKDNNSSKKSELSFRKLTAAINQSANTIVITDIYGNIEFVNPKFTELTGYTAEEAIGQNPRILNAGTQPKEYYESMWKTISNGKTWKGEFHNKTKYNELFWEQVTISPIKDDYGQIINYLGIKENITAVRESELRLKTLMNISPNAIYLKDGKGQWIEANKTGLKLFGLENIDFKGHTDEELALQAGFYKEALLYCKQTDEQAWEKGETTISEELIPILDGNFKTYEVTKMPQFNSDGTRKGLVIVGNDITDRKETIKLLVNSEERFKSMMLQSPNPMEIYNLDGLQISVNKAYENLWGFPAETSVNIFNLFESKEVKNTGLLEFVQRAYEGESVDIPEYQFNPRGETEARGLGRVRWLSTKIFPIKDNKGSVQNIVITHQDITNNKHAELVQKVLYNISNMVSTTDSLEECIHQIQIELGRLIDTSNFYVGFYDPIRDVINLPYYSDEKDDFKEAKADKTLSKHVITTEKPLLANRKIKEKMVKDGLLVHQGSKSKIWLGVPLKLNGKVIGVCAVQSYHDKNAYNESDMKILEFVSDQISISLNRKKTEEELKLAAEKALESDRLKSAFLANMSHEIRTPMNGILGFSGLLKDSQLSSEQQKEYIEIIEKSGVRMLNIINDIIEISKIESNQMTIAKSDCNAIEVLNDLYQFFKPEASNKSLQLIFNNTNKERQIILDTDSDKLNAILTNLIKNSIKYTHEGSIEFGFKRLKNYIEFYVKDTGIGIPTERLSAVFERFVQADIEDRSVYEGAGLGLAITKAYVDMLGGSIRLESEINIGTTCYFTIPYNKKDMHTVSSIKQKDIIQNLNDKSLNLKLLIAEDEEIAYRLLSITIKAHVREILHARNGQEAIDIARKNPDIDLILMDVRMPLVNGYSATKEIRKFNSEVIIIAQTANALSEDRERTLEAGCTDYLSKPIDKYKLFEKLEEYFT